jgi:chromate transport protein ChrA
MKTFDSKDIYELSFGLSNIILVLFAIILSVHLAAPLLGGKFLPTALIYYGSIIVFALVGRRVFGHARKELKMRAIDYALLCIAATFNFIVWFKYPVGIILSILLIISMAISYRAQGKRIKQESQ